MLHNQYGKLLLFFKIWFQRRNILRKNSNSITSLENDQEKIIAVYTIEV